MRSSLCPHSDSRIIIATSVRNMDRLSTAASLRTTRPSTRSRNRTRPMSPSPRPNLRRPFADPVSSTMFITTDYDYNYISPSSPDSDLIFNMSPIQSHILPSSPPGREPINVMTLRNKAPKKNSPPLSPLLYSFPRPSRLHPYMKQNTTASKDILSSKPLSSISQNFGALTLDSVRSAPSSQEIEAGPIGEDRPLAASLVESILPPIQKREVIAPSNPTRSPLQSQPSSPIPIPRHTPRQSDPGPFVTQSIPSPPLSTHFSHKIDCTPLPSSGIASHVASAGLRSVGKNHSGNTSPAGSSASLEPLRIEGFDASESECNLLETGDEKISAPSADFRSSVVSSTAYSFSDSAPFRFSRFLGPDPKDHNSEESADGETEYGTFLMQKNFAGETKDGRSRS